ncbi:GtrA family protein [candidate division WWE3 bacterium]|uniref:GtrA family protein n=1 Tax=candidate division WWE3 bacterium TaxID=2053526 RepID=A0A928TTI7_UNCKA|nr:GtrA family protein [candidate division WWE3 bacterium]
MTLGRTNAAWTWERVWSETWNLFKFGIVGITSLGINVGAYAVLSRVLWVHGPKTLEAVMAVFISAIFNFLMHYHWTFRARGFGVAMMFRYAAVVLIGTGLHGGFFYLGHEVFGLYDFAVLVGLAFIVAIATYLLHRWFTFRYHYADRMPPSGPVPHSQMTQVGE